MYVDPFWAGFVAGVGVGWVSLVALVYVAARRQRNGPRSRLYPAGYTSWSMWLLEGSGMATGGRNEDG